MGKAKVTTSSSTKAKKAGASSDALTKFTKPALALKPDAVEPCRDVHIAIANAQTGVAAVFDAPGSKERKARVAELKKALPTLSVAKVLELPDLGRALRLAHQKAAPATASEIEARLAVVSKHRGPMLEQAEVLAQKGLLSARAVANIRAGNGRIDLAEDGIALADLYATNAKEIHGKHPFTDADFAEMLTAAEWLLDHLAPGGAKKAKAKKSAAEDLRDRLWTLFAQRHSDLRVMGFYLFREDVDATVPKLQARTLGARAAASASGDEPAKTNDAPKAAPAAEPATTNGQAASATKEEPAAPAEG